VVKAKLVDPRFPTGDSCLFAAGELVFVYPPALTAQGLTALRSAFGQNLVTLSQADAQRLAGNSYAVTLESGSIAFVPEGTSEAVTGPLREQRVRVEKVDLSEFIDKGGGGPKSLVLNIGPIIDNPTRPAPADDMVELRDKRRYNTLAKSGGLP
jgi:hypothetical protein